jgi:radical SAM superfamily enzyme YgiQ (UPF0313 family)
MRAAGDILLISCYELGHQPIGLASPLGQLERAGYAPAAIDLALAPLDEAAVRRARFVGVSVPMHTALRIGLRAARRVRALNATAHICFYGLYAPLNRELLFRGQPPPADSVVGGEYEQELVARVRAVEIARGGEPPRAAFLAPGGRGASPIGEETVIARIGLGPPSRGALPELGRYARLRRADGSERLAGYTEASRGCLHRCRHCPIPALYDGRFFVVPEEVVLEDVRHLVAAGAEHVTLGDPDFLNGPGHALSVARAIHREFPSLTFDVTAKIEHLLRRRALLPELGRLGCLFVVSAVESLSQRVLDILDKGHTRADVALALDAVRAAGMTLRPSLVPFTPWSTLDDYLELFDFIEEHDLAAAIDPVQLTIRLLLPPGSLLLAHPATRPHLSREAALLEGERLTYRWTHPDPRMDALQREAEAMVARARADEPPSSVLARLRALALSAASGVPVDELAPLRFATEGAPRLTESWFC